MRVSCFCVIYIFILLYDWSVPAIFSRLAELLSFVHRHGDISGWSCKYSF